jgi:hypothetical protein
MELPQTAADSICLKLRRATGNTTNRKEGGSK